jgi:membrane protein
MKFVPRRLNGKLGMLPSFAAAMAFYFLVSLVPFLIVVSKALAWAFSMNLTPQLAAFLRDVLPPESRMRPEAVSAAVQAGSGTGLGLASTVVAIATASSGMNELARAVHFIFSDPERPNPGGWRRRLKSLGLLAVWTVAIVFTAVFLVLLPVARAALARVGGEAIPQILAADVRYPAAFALLLAAFVVTYYFVPERAHRPSWRAAAQGALLAAGAWLGTCFVFAYFLPRVWGVSLFHGVLGSALATLVWAYCGCWGVLLGACWAALVEPRPPGN